jgi:hypothetical protein
LFGLLAGRRWEFFNWIKFLNIEIYAKKLFENENNPFKGFLERKKVNKLMITLIKLFLMLFLEKKKFVKFLK